MKTMGLALGLVGQGWYPDAGGVESHTRDLARELLRRGHRVHGLALDLTPGLEPYALAERDVEGVPVARMAYRYHDHRELMDLVENPWANEVVLRWLSERSLDLVHVHHASGFGLGILPRIRSAGAALVMTLHDYWPLCPRGQMVRTDGAVCDSASPTRCAPCLARTWPHLMPSRSGEPGAADEEAARVRGERARSYLLATHRLFTPSEATRAVYSAHGIRRVEIVENGIEVEGLAREVERLRASAPPRSEIRLGVIGTVLPSKGALELARALLAARVPDLVLEIHGATPSYHGDLRYVEELREMAQREPVIRLRGPFEHGMLAQILANLDGVAAPSRWNEVYGLTVREARAAGLPVLVSTAGALPEVVERGAAGLVVPADDPGAWGAALRRFADPGERKQWSALGKKPRDARAMTLQLEKAYVEVVENVRGRVPPLEYVPGSDEPVSRSRWTRLRDWLGGARRPR